MHLVDNWQLCWFALFFAAVVVPDDLYVRRDFKATFSNLSYSSYCVSGSHSKNHPGERVGDYVCVGLRLTYVHKRFCIVIGQGLIPA